MIVEIIAITIINEICFFKSSENYLIKNGKKLFFEFIIKFYYNIIE